MLSVVVCYFLIFVKVLWDRCKLLGENRSLVIYVFYLFEDYFIWVKIDEKELEVGMIVDYLLLGVIVYERMKE